MFCMGYYALKNAKAYRSVYTRLNGLQTEYSSLMHALVSNIVFFNDEGDDRTCLPGRADDFSIESTVYVLASKEGCGGCVISLINQVIDYGVENIIVLLETNNQQIESAFAGDETVSVRVEPQTFFPDAPQCRIISCKDNRRKVFLYYPEMADYLQLLL